MKITVLIENTKQDDCLACEHGLSLLIEFEGKKYLLDSGSTDAFLENADQLGESLGDVEWAFLSHGHWDHSGGFAEYLRRYPDKILYMGQGAAGDFASDANETEMHDISIPADLKTDFTKQIRVLAGKTKLASDIWALPHTTPGLEKTGLLISSIDVITCLMPWCCVKSLHNSITSRRHTEKPKNSLTLYAAIMMNVFMTWASRQ